MSTPHAGWLSATTDDPGTLAEIESHIALRAATRYRNLGLLQCAILAGASAFIWYFAIYLPPFALWHLALGSALVISYLVTVISRRETMRVYRRHLGRCRWYTSSAGAGA